MGVKGTSFLFKGENAYVCLSVAILGFFVSLIYGRIKGILENVIHYFIGKTESMNHLMQVGDIGVYRIPIRAQYKSGSSKLDLGVATVIPTQL